ncbi:chromatin complexes subunit BAP18-like [Pollicipes pollicipes]|uniref:chromatin complexes subunit BAP18-like n=1 Tax=Pollicipes pollicipes TaxID=41117 RepID=UPI0018849C01|nr:chromatin complexes subunit BAP18-like [Pollicipes pollicipes]XP_037076015.1 chromatin complexes subunit BAP18-like [Pollicipes pollicipes]
MSSASKVGEIFCDAGKAFNKLGTLTIQLQQASQQAPNSGKWREEEIEMLHGAVRRFASDLQKISDTMKSRSVSQIRNALKKKAFDEAGMQAQASAGAAKLSAKSDVTLNMLNAAESEVDVEEMGHFDGPSEEVSS